jgi:sulfur-carrier protein
MAQLLYFAWVRERIGISGEHVALPAAVTTVSDLLDWLSGRGDGYAAALAQRERIRIAVNQDYVGLSHAIQDGDEIALFPPVTGG